jgi:hypothetical protein
MLTLGLPTETASYQLRAELEGVSFLIDMHWNERQAAWLMSLATDDGTALVHGVTVVCNRLLLRRYKYRTGMPAGDLMAMDPTRETDTPGYDQLGTTIQLVYVTEAELA